MWAGSPWCGWRALERQARLWPHSCVNCLWVTHPRDPLFLHILGEVVGPLPFLFPHFPHPYPSPESSQADSRQEVHLYFCSFLSHPHPSLVSSPTVPRSIDPTPGPRLRPYLTLLHTCTQVQAPLLQDVPLPWFRLSSFLLPSWHVCPPWPLSSLVSPCSSTPLLSLSSQKASPSHPHFLLIPSVTASSLHRVELGWVQGPQALCGGGDQGDWDGDQ